MRGSPPKADMVVTLDTYECSPAHRRWASQHTRELCSTQCIARGGGPVAVLPRRMLDFGSWQLTDLAGSTLTVQQFLNQTYTDAFLVLHKGEIVTEEYFSGMRPDAPHRVYSAGKSVLADVVAILVEHEKLRLNACVIEYIPELASSAYAGATVRQLLDMQSGVKYEYDMATPHTSMTEQGRHFRAAGLFRKLPGECPSSGQYDFFLTLDKKCRDHGLVFSYKCSDTGVLAWACERATGRRFADLVSSHIWSKIGVEQDASIVCDPQGASTPNGGMSTTLRDLARWGQMHLEGGTCRGQRVVPAKFVEDISASAEASKVTSESSPPPDFLQPGWAYRSQFWLPEGADGPFCARRLWTDLLYRSGMRHRDRQILDPSDTRY